MKILVVDDYRLVRTLVKRALTGLGYQDIHEASHGDKAVEILERELALAKPFDLVFLDWNMPGKTGIEVIEFCRAHPQLKDLSILMISVESEEQKMQKALRAGANGFIVKPFSPAGIEQALGNIACKSA